MSLSGGILLTGATGQLGRYLLRDLLLSGRKVAVLVRDHPSASAGQRITRLLSFWQDHLGARLPSPVVVAGDLANRECGLTTAVDRAWLGRSCRSVVHAAACVGFRATVGGEPYRTNVEGTRHLLRLCRHLRWEDFHHLSTAFVCGARTGTIREDELECGQAFHNDYEKSKFEAERLVRQMLGGSATVYRPSVIVGDSRTGYTSSYHGFYRFLELIDTLAGSARSLPLRFPGTGAEPRNLVSVDHVAKAITRIVGRKEWHGGTYHLVARKPVLARRIKEVAERLLGISGMSWAGPGGATDPTDLERLFEKHLHDYWPYRHGDPAFSDTNTREALPDLSVPEIDRPMLERLITFARKERWGRPRNRRRLRRSEMDCSHYVEEFFPEAARRSGLAEVPLDVVVGLDVLGPGGGRWSFSWLGGELQSVQRGLAGDAAVVYRLDRATFSAIVQGRLALQDAFFARQIEILGHLEKGLKLAALFARFAEECPYGPSREETIHAPALHA
jgi:nucleoside-diphosphate-sugar epimerase